MAKIVILGNQKGGSGKTTGTMLFANYLHQMKNKRILVIDTDTLQKSYTRSREYSLLDGINENLLYQVIDSNPVNVPKIIEEVSEDFDYIFLDLPGNLMEKGVISCYLLADFIIVPTACTRKDLDSTSIFLTKIFKDVIPIREKHNLETNIIGCVMKTNPLGVLYKNFKEDYDNNLIPIKFFNEVIPFSEVLDEQVDTVNKVTYINKNFHIKRLYGEFEQFLNI